MTSTTLRVEGRDGGWLEFNCKVLTPEPGDVSRRVLVPELKAEWLIAPHGMFANVGGNDWAIYTVHPDDCERICNLEAGEVPAHTTQDGGQDNGMER